MKACVGDIVVIESVSASSSWDDNDPELDKVFEVTGGGVVMFEPDYYGYELQGFVPSKYHFVICKVKILFKGAHHGQD